MRKPSKGSDGWSIPSSGWHPLVSESCVEPGRPGLRSVDSERGGPRDSAPKDRDEEADTFFCFVGRQYRDDASQSARLLRGP